MPPYRLDFVQCLACGHVWNRAFRYEDVLYGSQPSLMFNAGVLWNRHLAQLADEVLTRLPENPTVVEIGCGCGHFLRSLAARRQGRYIGFDPHQPDDFPSEFQFEARLFDPVEDLLPLQPDLVVMRHVLEHFSQPAAFLQQLAWAAGCCKIQTKLAPMLPALASKLSAQRS
jgi:2-polyprenyl-3-methyl-5-hydroxy-6-metoxy-1,4-benzoquinol methylase